MGMWFFFFFTCYINQICFIVDFSVMENACSWKTDFFPSWNNLGILIKSISTHDRYLFHQRFAWVEFQGGGSTFSIEIRGLCIIFKLYKLKPLGMGRVVNYVKHETYSSLFPCILNQKCFSWDPLLYWTHGDMSRILCSH